jgi:hypothetical protein
LQGRAAPAATGGGSRRWPPSIRARERNEGLVPFLFSCDAAR